MGEHGHYILSSENQILTLKASGAWNIETVKSCCEAFKDAVEQLKEQSWSCLFELTDWELGPPEMWNEIIALNHWSEVNNKKLEAVVITNNIQKFFFEKSHKNYVKTQPKIFDSEVAARLWLSD
jgi:hypothetical protein